MMYQKIEGASLDEKLIPAHLEEMLVKKDVAFVIQARWGISLDSIVWGVIFLFVLIGIRIVQIFFFMSAHDSHEAGVLWRLVNAISFIDLIVVGFFILICYGIFFYRPWFAGIPEGFVICNRKKMVVRPWSDCTGKLRIKGNAEYGSIEIERKQKIPIKDTHADKHPHLAFYMVGIPYPQYIASHIQKYIATI